LNIVKVRFVAMSVEIAANFVNLSQILAQNRSNTRNVRSIFLHE